MGADVGEDVEHSRLFATMTVVFEAGTIATGSHPELGEPVAAVQLHVAAYTLPAGVVERG